MSEEQLKAFIAKVQADASLQEQLKADGADVVAIAKAAGFTITTEELKSHRQNLSDLDLETAVGGTYPTEPCICGQGPTKKTLADSECTRTCKF